MPNPDSSVFTGPELTFLNRSDIGRVATVDASGLPHLAAVSYWHNSELDTIDMVSQDMANSLEFSHVRARGWAAFLVDDVVPPWRPHSVEVRGPAEAVVTSSGAVIRIRPAWISCRGLDGVPVPRTRRLNLLAGKDH